MRRALIGHTGFVGSNLARSGTYDAFFNSKNYQHLAGQRFDEVVCAGVTAVKWMANKEPVADWAAICALKNVLAAADIARFVLVSTIDVYPDPSQALDESFDPTGLPNHAYGKHRLQFENWARGHFSDCTIVRLPGLFGPGLKKNVIFDLLKGNQVEEIDPASVFQWYPVARLSSDMKIIVEKGLRLVNLFPEPLQTAEIVKRLFAWAETGPPSADPIRYDLRTRYGRLFGGSDRYAMEAEAVLTDLDAYIGTARESSE